VVLGPAVGGVTTTAAPALLSAVRCRPAITKGGGTPRRYFPSQHPVPVRRRREDHVGSQFQRFSQVIGPHLLQPSGTQWGVEGKPVQPDPRIPAESVRPSCNQTATKHCGLVVNRPGALARIVLLRPSFRHESATRPPAAAGRIKRGFSVPKYDLTSCGQPVFSRPDEQSLGVRFRVRDFAARAALACGRCAYSALRRRTPAGEPNYGVPAGRWA
jgi:hypothetical protein